MRKLFGALLAAVLVTGLLSATAITATRNWTLVQKPDGTTVFRENAGGSGNEVRVDRRFITVHLTDIGQTTTYTIASPMTGYISQVFASIGPSVNASTGLRVAVGTTCAAGNGTLLTGGTMMFGSYQAPVGMVRSAIPTANNAVSSGQNICIGSDGAATNLANGMATIVIDGNF